MSVTAIFLLIASSYSAASPAASPFGSNRIVNASFDYDFGSLDINHIVKPTDWSTDALATVVQYGGLDGLPTVADHDDSVVVLQGKNFLAGGPGRQNDVAKAWQRIDLRDASPYIERKKAHYELAASLGGRSAKADFAKVWVRFLDDKKRQITGPLGIEPTLRFDRRGKTRFVRHACSDLIPPEARYAQISIGAYKLSGSDNHAYVDDVSFVLRYGYDATQGMSHCVASGVDNSSELLARALQIDDASRSCVDNEHFVLAVAVGFMGLLLMLLVQFGDGAAYDERTVRFFNSSRTVRVWRGAGRGISVATVVGAAAFVGTYFILWQARTLSYAECGLRETLIPRPWTFYPALFCLLTAFDLLAAIIVFVHLKPLHPQSGWRRLCVRIVIFLYASLASLAVLSWWAPTGDQLDHVNALMLILGVPLSYMWLAMRDSIKRYRKELKWGIAFLLVLPTFQPFLALWNVHVIQSQRIHHEIEHRYFDVNVGRDYALLSGVLFYAPTTLDYREPGRVVFSAHLSHVTDKAPRSCLVPRFAAPGFDVQVIASDAVPLARRDVRWEWIVSPQREGRQFFFVDVLYSPTCRHGTGAAGSLGDDFTLLFNQTDSAFVSRQWFSVEDLTSALPWISFLAAIITLMVGVLDMRTHAKPSENPPQKPNP